VGISELRTARSQEVLRVAQHSLNWDDSVVSEISETDAMLTRLYQAAAEIGNQRAETAEAGTPAEHAMLAAAWNECQLEIKKVQDSEAGNSHADAEAFLALIYSASS
tara:strand:+ start:11037 stop:11357 length:321 start_codon:yes stop_codon:yes gene_type:complete